MTTAVQTYKLRLCVDDEVEALLLEQVQERKVANQWHIAIDLAIEFEISMI